MARRKTGETIIHKTFPFVVDESKADARIITGDANVYGILDSVGDIVEQGAFKRSLANDDVRPLLWQHYSDEVIGDGVFAETDGALRLTDGKLYEGVQRADEAYAIAKQARRPLGLSIGFSIPSGGAYTDDDGVRHITEAKLYEVSLVTFPANEPSRIDSVKSDDVDCGFIEAVTDPEYLASLDDEDIEELKDTATYLLDALTPEDDKEDPEGDALVIEADEARKYAQSVDIALAALV